MLSNPLKRDCLAALTDALADRLCAFRIQVLVEQRALLQRVLGRIDARIRALGGPRRVARKPRGAVVRGRAVGESLRGKVLQALQGAGGPVKAATLVDLVQEAGYKTSAKRTTLLTSIYHVLADRRVFRKVGKGVFGLAKAPSPRGAAKRKKRAKATEVGAK